MPRTAVTDAPLDVGAVLQNRYKLEERIGRGGMATVFLARDVKHDRRVAIKVLRPELSDDPEAMAAWPEMRYVPKAQIAQWAAQLARFECPPEIARLMVMTHENAFLRSFDIGSIGGKIITATAAATSRR